MDDVGTQRAHAKVAIAALASLYSTAFADERGLAAVELGKMLALATAAKDSDMNRVLGLGLFVPADAERVAIAHAFELRSFVYSRRFRQMLNSRIGRMR